MSILIGADFVPTETNVDLFEKADIINLFGADLCGLLHAAEYRIFNLEVPLTDKSVPISKWGPALIAPVKTVDLYKKIGVDLLTLANNHIMDQGKDGLLSTLQTLDENGISYVGAGKSIFEAQMPHIFMSMGKKIGVYACAEHEFSIADKEHGGANPFDALNSLDHVSELKKNCDFLIVLYHGGKEHYRYPSPMLQKICHKLIEKGANLVICQHSHCIGCEENYQGGKIVYGQGNFLFDHNESEFWQTSLLIEITDDFQISYYPIVKSGALVRLASQEQETDILHNFYDRSREIQKPLFIEQHYKEFSRNNMLSYAIHFSNQNRSFLYRIINKLLRQKIDKLWLSHYIEKQGLAIINYMECEAHRELVLTAIKDICGKRK